MSKPTLSFLLLYLCALTAGTIGGMAITWKVAGAEKGIPFLYFGAATQSLIFACQLCTYLRAQKELLFQLYYLASFGLTMVWVMLCLFLPLLWVGLIQFPMKLILAGMVSFLFSSNLMYAFNYINKERKRIGAEQFEQIFDLDESSVDWDMVANSMKIAHVIYVPGLPQSWSRVFEACLVVSMLAGFNLRITFPTFAILATGIPCAIAASFFLQMSGYYFMQARKVELIQTRSGVKIKSTG